MFFSTIKWKELLYPPRCILCDQLLEMGSRQYLCEYCSPEKLWVRGVRCPICSRPVEGEGQLCRNCRREGRRIPGRAAFVYGETVRRMIARYKYEGIREAAPLFAQWMLQADADYIRFLRQSPFFLVPVPVHPGRLRERGFNQALLLAEELGKCLKVPVFYGLTRIRSTKAMKSLSAHQRQNALDQAFWAAEGEIVPKGNAVLIDDIYTSGSTIEACSKALLERWPRLKIYFWTLAIRKDPDGQNVSFDDGP